MASTSIPRPRRLPPLHRPPGEVDELERMAAEDSRRGIPQRSRAILGLLVLVLIALTVGLVCARTARLSTPIDPAHVMPIR